MYVFIAGMATYAIGIHMLLSKAGTGLLFRPSGVIGLAGVGAALGLLAAAALCKRAGYGRRVWLLTGGLVVASLTGVHRSAFLLPHNYSIMLIALLVATLLSGPRAAWATFGGLLLALCAYAALFIGGTLDAVLIGLDATEPLDWLRTLVGFAAIAGITIGSVGFLIRRLEQAVLEGDRLLRAVEDQNEQRGSAVRAQHELTAQLRHAQKLDAVGRLAGGVAHDFNNLLVVILNSAELARERTRDAETRELLDSILEAGDGAARLTRQLLAFGRRHVVERRALPVNDAIQRSLELVRPVLPAGIKVDAHLSPDAGWIWAADTDLDQILMNLCLNARDAMPEGGTLTIQTEPIERAAPDGDAYPHVRIRVADTGRGMTAEECERSFEPFFTTKVEGEHSGLGLSVVDGIVAQSGGTIHVSSALGGGTRFDVELPSCPEPQELEERLVAVEGAGGETLLVADDDVNARRILATRLRAAGYRVLECGDGLEALQIYDEHQQEVALVVTDVVMPRMSGRALCEALGERAPRLPVLFWSGHASRALSMDFLDHPLRGFLAKPFGGRQLLAKVRILLERSRSAAGGPGSGGRA